MADSLREILDIARREAADVSPEVWARIERQIRNLFGGQRPYIAAQRKRAHLERLAELDANLDAERLAQKLGVSVRRARQLKALR